MLKKMLSFLIFVLLSCQVLAAQPLSPEQAFSLQFKSAAQANTFAAQFKIAPHHFLYQNKLIFTLQDPGAASITKIILPDAIKKQDKLHGVHYIYKDNLQVLLTINNPEQKTIHLKAQYQGCSEQGFCYPPITKQISVENPNSISPKISIIDPMSVDTSSETASNETSAESLLAHHNKFFALLTFFGFGLLLAFTPCVLPMLPILSGIIVGQGKDITTYKAFLLSLTYVLTMAFTYAIAGVLLATLGSNLQTALQNPWVIVLFSGLFVLLSLSLFGFYELQMPARWQEKLTRYSQNQQAGTYVGVAIMGFLSTLIVSPCVTAPLVGALTYIANTGNIYFGGSALFVLGMGMGLPLLIAGTSFGKFLPKAGMWMEFIKKVFGILMLAVAILMLARIISPEIQLFLWGTLAVIAAFLFTRKIFRIPLLVYAVVLITGAALGNHDPLHPFSSPQERSSLKFVAFQTLPDIQKQIQTGAHQHQFTLLDFSAEWCTSCKMMEKHTFTHPSVMKQLKQFNLIKADVTSNDKSVKELQKFFSVLAPPTLLFFDKDGHELKEYRVVGEMNAEEFNKLLHKILD